MVPVFAIRVPVPVLKKGKKISDQKNAASILKSSGSVTKKNVVMQYSLLSHRQSQTFLAKRPKKTK
jgi:hypothetical protein